MSDPSDEVSAFTQRASILTKLRNLRQTLDGIAEMPGMQAAVLDKCERAKQVAQALKRRVDEEWKRITQPVEVLAARLAQARTVYGEATQLYRTESLGLQRLLTQFAQLDPLEDPQHYASRKEEIETKIAQARSANEAAERRVVTTSAAVQELERELAASKEVTAAALERSDHGLDLVATDVNELLEEARALRTEALNLEKSERTAAVSEAIRINRADFQSARDFHRESAEKALSWLAGLGVITLLALVAVLIPWDEAAQQQLSNPHRQAAPADMAADGGLSTRRAGDAPDVDASGLIDSPPPVSTKNSVAAVHATPAEWLHALLSFGGRLSFVAGLAWVAVFLGRQNSLHSQQAVSYQDRLAGLDAAEWIINHATQSEREGVLRQMLSTYLSLDTNAFKPRPTKELTSRDLLRLSKTAERIIRAGSAAASKGRD